MSTTTATYCRLCGKPAGSGHEPWCPSNDDITVSRDLD